MLFSMTSFRFLFGHRSFSPLFWTQFLGAFNDNYFKNAMILLLTFQNAQAFGLNTQSLIAAASGVFILPFVLFSSVAGALSDKYPKARVGQSIKLAEVAIMILAGYAFSHASVSGLFFCLFLLGLHSTFFGPVKYSILPELVREEELVAGNAYVELGTFLAILIGTVTSGIAISHPSGTPLIFGGLIAVSIAGLFMSFLIPVIPGAQPNLRISWNPISDTWRTLRLALPQKAVFNSLLGISWFWFLGGALLSILPVLTESVLHANAGVVTYFLGLFTIGIAIGSVGAEKLSHGRVEIGLVPIGSFGMTIFLLDLAYATSQVQPHDASLPLLTLSEFIKTPDVIRISIDLAGIAIFGGLFTVPLYTLMQSRSDRAIRSRIVGANNVLNAVFMVVSAGMLLGFYALGFSLGHIFLIYGALNLVVALYIYRVVPEFLWRFMTFVLSSLMYRLKTTGHENIPFDGPAILVSNHVSFIDWCLIGGAVKRPVRFVMYYQFFKIPVLKRFFKDSKTIPIAGPQEDSKIFHAAFRSISDELKQGELICIFPEGGITHDGKLQPLKRGIEHMLKTDPVPVVPMALSGLWGSLFSRREKNLWKKRPRRLWSRVELRIGAPIPAHEATLERIREEIQKLKVRD